MSVPLDAIQICGIRTNAIIPLWLTASTSATRWPPARPATDILGTIRPEIAARTGLPTSIPVYVGIHDSNASLLPHLLGSKPPFSVISTGTWVIAMSVGGKEVALDPKRDTLINVNAFGNPVPSARFMGGRNSNWPCKGTPPLPHKPTSIPCWIARSCYCPLWTRIRSIHWIQEPVGAGRATHWLRVACDQRRFLSGHAIQPVPANDRP